MLLAAACRAGVGCRGGATDAFVAQRDSGERRLRSRSAAARDPRHVQPSRREEDVKALIGGVPGSPATQRFEATKAV
jgi:hypothetical protein